MDRRRDRTGLAIATALAGVVLVAGCSDFPEGPAGIVTDRDRDVKVKSKTVHENGKAKVKTETKVTYELTTQTEGGEPWEFKVSSEVYERCQLGEKYPACAK